MANEGWLERRPAADIDRHSSSGLAERALAAAGPDGDTAVVLIESIDRLAGVFAHGWEEMVEHAPHMLARIGTDPVSVQGGLAIGLQASYLVCRAFLGLGGATPVRVAAMEAAIERRLRLTAPEYADDLPLSEALVEEWAEQSSLLDNVSMVVDLLADSQAQIRRSATAQAAVACVLDLAAVAGRLDTQRAFDLEDVLWDWERALTDALENHGLEPDPSAARRFGPGWHPVMDDCLAWKQHPLLAAYDGLAEEAGDCLQSSSAIAARSGQTGAGDILSADAPGVVADGIYLLVLTTGRPTPATHAAGTLLCETRGLMPSAVWTPRFPAAFATPADDVRPLFRQLLLALGGLESNDRALVGTGRRVATAALRLAHLTADMIDRTDQTARILTDLSELAQDSLLTTGAQPLSASFLTDLRSRS